MDYNKIYLNLIKTRKHLNRMKSSCNYYESHHILPKCLDGGENDNNIILLTAREHYLAHWLLYKIYPHDSKIALAFWKMSMPQSKFVKRDYYISSYAYEEAKLAMSNANRILNTGRKVNPIHLEKWKKNKNNSKEIINIKTGEKYSCAKKLWEDKYLNVIGYKGFILYIAGKHNFKNNSVNRKMFDETIYDWRYVYD